MTTMCKKTKIHVRINLFGGTLTKPADGRLKMIKVKDARSVS